jgi:hypothetical protein
VQQRWVRVVFAGYRAMTRLFRSSDSPFYNALRDVELTPLTQAESNTLISEPFRLHSLEIPKKPAFFQGRRGFLSFREFYVCFRVI